MKSRRHNFINRETSFSLALSRKRQLGNFVVLYVSTQSVVRDSQLGWMISSSNNLLELYHHFRSKQFREILRSETALTRKILSSSNSPRKKPVNFCQTQSLKKIFHKIIWQFLVAVFIQHIKCTTHISALFLKDLIYTSVLSSTSFRRESI